MASLYRRGDVYYSSIRINGKHVRKPLATNKKVAEEKLGDMIKYRNHAKYGEPIKHIGWEAFKEQYMEYSATKAPATHKRDIMAIRSIEKYFALVKITDITPELLEMWRGRRRRDGIGVATVNRDLGAIKAMLHKAELWKYIAAQPWASVKRFKETSKKLLFYSDQDIDKLLNVCHDHWKTVAYLGAKAGLRRSEIRWLKWSDIDLKSKMLSVTAKEGWNPKDYEQRHIPLSQSLYDHLMTLDRTGGFVLGDPPPSDGVMSTYFKRLIKKAGLKGNLHTLRHTFASHLVQRGIPLYEVSKLLGHSHTKTTEIYAHLAPANMETAVKVLT